MSTLKQNRINKEFYWANDLFLTIISMVFEENQEQKEKSSENSIDLHVDLTNKIDKIIGKSDHDSSSIEQIDDLTGDISLKKLPVETRLPLSKKINTYNVKLGLKPESVNNQELTTNNGFKSDINFNDIHNSKNNIKDRQPGLNDSIDNRIEIIDFDSLNKGEIKGHEKTTFITIEKPKIKDHASDKSKKFNIIDIFGKKAEVNDKTSKKMTFFNFKQPKKTNSEAQVYFLRNSKQQVEDKSIKSKSEKSSVSNSLDNELNKLKEKEIKLKEEKKKLIEREKEALKGAKERNSLRTLKEKKNKERHLQEEKLRKLELKKAMLEKKQREKEAIKAAKKNEFEMKKKAKEEKLLKKIEIKKAIKLEKEKELVAKKAEKDQQIRQMLHDKEKLMKEREAKKTGKIAFKNDKELKKLKIGDFFKKESEKKTDSKNILEVDKATEIAPNTKDLQQEVLDDDVKKLLTITDNLLGELPEEVIDKFAKSEDFELYSRVLNKYRIK